MNLNHFVFLLLIPAILGSMWGGASNQPGYIDWTTEFNKFRMNSFSLPKPFYLVRGTLPFFHIGGSTLVNDDYIRLTASEKSQNGWLWSQRFIYMDSWEVHMTIRIGGGGALGADGLAFWYSLDPRKEGGAFGSTERWNGLGVFFDTFDNDGQGDHPIIRVLVNDGSWTYDPSSDGKNMAISECRCYFRNAETSVRIAYTPGRLQILTQIPPSNDWSLCTQVATNLPPRGYLGVSAATGGLTDNHDLLSFVTYQLNKPNQDPATAPPSETDKEIEKLENSENNPEENQPPKEQQNQYQQPPQQENQYQPPPQQNQYQQPPQQQNQYQAPPQQQNQYQPPPQQNQYQQPPQQQNQYQPPAQNQYQQPPQEQNQYQPPPQQNQYQAPPQQQNQYQPPPQQNQYQPPPQQNQYQQQQQPQQTAQLSEQNILAELRQLKITQDSLVNMINGLQAQITSVSQDVRANNGQFHQIAQQQEQLSQKLNNNNNGGRPAGSEVGAVLTQLGELQRSLHSRTFDDAESIKRLVEATHNQIVSIARKIEVSVNEQLRLSDQLRDTTSQITNSDSSNSWGFWYLFIMFQVIFGVAFMWWKKYKDERNKKLF